MQVHAFQTDLHFSFEYIITDLIILIEVIAIESTDLFQETTVKIAQRVQITVGKVYRKYVVIPVISVLGRFKRSQSGTIFIVIIQDRGQLFVVREGMVCVHQFTGGKYADGQRNPAKEFQHWQ